MSLKLSEEVLLEIVDIVRHGIMHGKDVSEMLRKIELVAGDDAKQLCLTKEYQENNKRID